MKNFRIKFYLIRGLLLIYLTNFLSKILRMEMPPLLSVAAIIEEKGKILAVNLTYKKGIALPGGHVREFENLEGALKREVFEETGLNIIKTRYFNSYFVRHKKYCLLNVTFITEAEGKLKSSEEGIPEWFNPEELSKKLIYKDNLIALGEYLKSNEYKK